MGVTLEQHRVAIGLYNTTNRNTFVKNRPNSRFYISKNEFLKITYGLVCVIYVYLICMLLAGAIETASNLTATKLHRTYNIGPFVANDIHSYLNCATILIVMIAYSRKYNYLFSWISKHGRPSYYFSAKRKCSRTQCLSNILSIWTTMLNLVLIVLCNTSLLNPGPGGSHNHISIMYQNVRGFVPFSGLGKSNMPLDTGKILDFQSKVYRNKPDVIILTETWLSNEHFSNEILPDDYTKYTGRIGPKGRIHPTQTTLKSFALKGVGF